MQTWQSASANEGKSLMNNQPTTLSDSLELNQKLKKRYEQTMNDGYAKLKMRLHTQVSTHNQPVELTDPLKKPENQKWVSEILTTLQSLRSLLMTSHDAHTRSAVIAQLSQLVEASHADLSRPMMNSLHSFLQASHGYVCVAGANALVKLAHRHPKVVHPVVIEVVIKYLFPLLSDRDCSIRQVAAETLGLLFQLGESGEVKGQTIDQILIPMCTRLLSSLLSQPVAETASLLLPILHMVGYETSGAGEKKTDLSKMAKQVLYRLISEAQVGDADGALNLSILMDVIQKQGFDAILDASSESKPFLKRVYQSALQSGHIDALKAGFIAQCMEHGCPALFDSEGGVTVEGHRYQLDEASQFYVDQWRARFATNRGQPADFGLELHDLEPHDLSLAEKPESGLIKERIECLLKHLREGEGPVRTAAIKELGKLAMTVDTGWVQVILDTFLSSLKAHLKGIDRESRATTVKSLGLMSANADAELIKKILYAFIPFLRDGDVYVRSVARESLRWLVEKAKDESTEAIVDVLVKLFKNSDGRVHETAARTLITLVERADAQLLKVVVDALLLLLGSSNLKISNTASEILKLLPTMASTQSLKTIIGGLLPLLQDSNNLEVRCVTAECLGYIAPQMNTEYVETIVDALFPLLKDNYARVRIAATKSLGALAMRIEIERVVMIVNVLLPLLKVWDTSVRATAAKSLAEITAAKIVDMDLKKIVIESLLPLLKNHNSDVRAAVAESLGEIGITAETGFVKIVIQSLFPLLKDSTNDVREATIVSLSVLAKKADTEHINIIADALLPLLKDSDEVIRESVVISLSMMAVVTEIDLANTVVKSFLPLLKDGDSDVRYAVVEGLGQLVTIVETEWVTTIIDALLRSLNDRNQHVRCAVIQSLGLVGTTVETILLNKEIIVVSLLPLLKDDMSHVRRLASKNLGLVAKTAEAELFKTTVMTLLPLLEDDISHVRCAVVESLGLLAITAEAELFQTIVVALIPLLADDIRNVRYGAVQSLELLLEQVDTDLLKMIFTALLPLLRDCCHIASVAVKSLRKIAEIDADLVLTKIVIQSLLPTLRAKNIFFTNFDNLMRLISMVDAQKVETIVDALIPFLKESDHKTLHLFVLTSLRDLTKKADAELLKTILDALLPLLEDIDSKIQERTEKYLQQILNNQPISTLMRLEEETNISKHQVAMNILTQVRTRQLSESSTSALPEHDLCNTDTESYTVHCALITYDHPHLNWIASPMVSNLLLDAYELGGEAFHNHLLEALYLPAQAEDLLEQIHQLGTQGMLLQQWEALQDQRHHGHQILSTHSTLATIEGSQIEQPIMPAISQAEPVFPSDTRLSEAQPASEAGADAWKRPEGQAWTPWIHAAGLGFKVLDITVDGLRWWDQPTFLHARTVLLDVTQCYGLYAGVNRYTLALHTADMTRDLYHGEYTAALQQAGMTLATLAFPWFLYQAGVPGILYGLVMTAYTGYQALSNVYAFSQERGTAAYQAESVRIYETLNKNLADSALQTLYHFKPWEAQDRAALEEEVDQDIWDQETAWTEM